MNRLDEMLRISRLSCKFEVIYPIRVPWHANDVTFLRTFDEDMAWIVPWAESKILKFTNISKFFKEIEVLRRAAVMVKKQQPLWGWHGMVSLFLLHFELQRKDFSCSTFLELPLFFWFVALGNRFRRTNSIWRMLVFWTKSSLVADVFSFRLACLMTHSQHSKINIIVHWVSSKMYQKFHCRRSGYG